MHQQRSNNNTKFKRSQSQNINSSANIARHNQQFQNQYVRQIQQRINQNVKIQIRPKMVSESNSILACLRNHFIFYNLNDNELENVKEKMYYTQVNINYGNGSLNQIDRNQSTVIYDEDTMGTSFFIVANGILEIIQGQKFKKTLKPGDGFGEIALLYNTKRKQTVRVKQNCKLWLIDRKTFRQAVQEVIVKEYTQNRKNLEGIKFFVNLTNEQKDLISSALITQKFYKNQTLVQEGDPGSAMYYIKEGTASVYKGSKFLRKLGKGDSFGQQSLYYNTMRQLTVKADQELTCLILGRDTLNRIMGDKVYQVTFKNFIRWAFQKNPVLSKLSKQHADNVIQSMKISSFKMNELILRKGVVGFQKLVVVIEGGLKKLKSGSIVAGKCQCYGQEFLLQQNKLRVLDDEIIMSTNGVIAQISDTSFYEALGNKQFIQVVKNIEQGKKKKGVQYENMINKQLEGVDASQLIGVKELAKGQFGDLYLVKDKKGNQFVAKTLNKFLIQDAEVSQFVIDQSQVLKLVSYPFIVRCGKNYQSEHHLVYITEYIKGQQFYEVLKKLGLLSTSDAQFYTATIIYILQYFENIEVICRDIKPQNFLVDQKGYLKLINLSTAKKCHVDSSGKIARTFTIIGTPHYMAPDIVLGKGYSNFVDLWSLGVCLYEFLCGTLPFGDSSQGPYQIYQQIMQKDLKFPQFIHDKKAKKLIQQLLSHSPQQRNGGSFQNLKNHPWFEKFQWQSLLLKQKSVCAPPYIPLQKSSMLNAAYSGHIKNKKLSQILQHKDKEVQKNQQYKNKKHSDIWQNFGKYI